MFTVDLEEWYCDKIFPGFNPDKSKDYVIRSTRPLLRLLEKYNIKAIFFVLGSILDKHPDLIKEIHEKGHEIASHGYSHKTLFKLTPDEFEKEIVKSRKMIHKITGKYPKWFRAPSFSLSNKTKWALPILKKHGFKYDSSIFPFESRYYGVNGCPQEPYMINFDDVRKKKDCGIKEYPIQIIKILKIPYIITGGFYFRLYPNWFINFWIRRLNNKGRQVMLFVHPWEFNKTIPKADISAFGKFVTYYGINRSLKKLERLIRKNKFNKFKR